MKPLLPSQFDLFGFTTITSDSLDSSRAVSTIVKQMPIKIEKHLLPYIYRCAVGEPVPNGPDTVVLRVNNKTAFGQFLNTIPLFVNGTEIRNKKIQIQYNKAKKEALFLHKTFNTRYEITVDKSMNIILNRILEDLFRIEFMLSVHEKPNISKAIMEFAEKHKLEDYGFDVESLRVYYYKERKRMEYFV